MLYADWLKLYHYQGCNWQNPADVSAQAHPLPDNISLIFLYIPVM
jgi:hypothetical protein